MGLYLDSDVGVAHGREVHGQPKKLASLRLETRGDLIVGEVERNGITILTATLPYKQRAVDPDELRRHFDFSREHQLQADPAHRRYPRDPAADGAAALGRAGARVLDRPVLGRAAPERAGAGLAAAGARAAGRLLLAGRLHARAPDVSCTTTSPRAQPDERPPRRPRRHLRGHQRRGRRRRSVRRRRRGRGRGHGPGGRRGRGQTRTVCSSSTGRSTRRSSTRCPSWRVIGRYGVGVDNVDLDAATEPRRSPSSTCPTTASRRSRRTRPRSCSPAGESSPARGS